VKKRESKDEIIERRTKIIKQPEPLNLERIFIPLKKVEQKAEINNEAEVVAEPQSDTKVEKEESNVSIKEAFELANRYYRTAMKINIIKSFLIYKSIFREIKDDFSGINGWEEEVIKLEKQFLNRFDAVLEQLGKGEGAMTKTYLEEIKAELLSLPKVQLPEFKQANMKSTFEEDFEKTMLAIKEDVKKGSRATFKLIQELQEKLDSLAELVDAPEEQQQEQVKETPKPENVYLKPLLDTFDQLDLILQSIRKVEAKSWSDSVELAVKRALVFLRDLGIEEIPTLGEMFDGKIMESIGAIPSSSVDTNVEQYHVYTVHQRGFRYIHDGQLIRKAKVITIL
jgi:molecular chaperone GrpE (heat shock protein)